MPSPRPTRELTVEFSHDGSTCRRKFFHPSGATFDGGTFDLAALRDARPKLFDGRADASDKATGADVFSLLMGPAEIADPTLQRLFENAVEPRAYRHPVRVKIRERPTPGVGALLELVPWRLARQDEVLLTGHGWTFELAPADRGGGPRPFRLQVPTQAVAILPGPRSLPHLADLEARMGDGRDAARTDPWWVRVEDRRSLESSLSARPRIVYFAGVCRLLNGEIALALNTDQPTVDDLVTVRELAALLADKSVQMLVLLLAGERSANHVGVAELLQVVPSVIIDWFPTVDEAKAHGARLLDQVLARGRDPVEVGSDPAAGRPLGLAGAAYDSFHIEKRTPSATSDWTAFDLDRERIRAQVLDTVHGLLRHAQRRVQMFIGHGGPGQHLEQLSGQLLRKLDREGRGMSVKLLELPLSRDPKLDVRLAIQDTMEAALKLDAGRSLGERLRRYVSAEADTWTEMPVLWIDWGTHGGARGRFGREEIEGWWSYLHDVLAPSCPPDMRIAGLIALEPNNPAKLQTLFDALSDSIEFMAPSYDVELLPGLESPPKKEIRKFLTESGCPPGLEVELAQEISRKAPDYETAVGLVNRGRRDGWRTLLSRLKASDDDDDDGDDDGDI